MHEQHCIFERVSSAEGVRRVEQLMAANSVPSRTALARCVCAEFGFRDAPGRPQIASCCKALRALDRRGCIDLPPPRRRCAPGIPRRLGQPVPPPVAVPDRVDDVQGLRLQLVSDDGQRRIWNELVASEHPQGAVCHVGAQLRYLVLSDHGILGAVGFAACAHALADRDRFIGWDADRRRRQLQAVLGLGRFLIRPSARCANLASKALSLCLRQLPDDAPRASFVSAAQRDRATVKAYYRMIDQPAESEMTPANILAPHRERTLQRLQGQREVLCLEDGSDPNFAEHPGCVGLGLVGKNANSKGTPGMHRHSTLAVSTDGIPPGVPRIQFDTPDGKSQRSKPPEERKTQRWVRGLRDCAAMAARLDGVRLVSVMDREADVFDLFAERRRLGTVDLLVRAKHNRSLGEDVPKLFDQVRAG